GHRGTGRAPGRSVLRSGPRTCDDERMTSTSSAAPTPSVPLPEGVTIAPVHGVQGLLVDTPAATAELLLDGAHLLSWIPAGQTDLLWLSPDSAFGADRKSTRLNSSHGSLS